MNSLKIDTRRADLQLVAQLRPSLDNLGQLLDPLDEGELWVAQNLDMLDDSWTVYIRPRIGHDVPDFVAVHELYGVSAIEVKSWQPGSYRMNGEGFVEVSDGDEGWRRSPEQPRYRAARYRFTTYDQFFAVPSDGPDPTEVVRSAVVLPYYTDEDAQRLLSHVSQSNAERKVAIWGVDGIRDELERVVRGAGCAHPRPESIQRLMQQIVPSETVESTERLEFSSDTRNLALNPSDTRFRRVRGPAGSGKSFGLAARAAQLALQGKRVLALSFNVALADYLSSLATTRCRELGANPTLITCSNFHSFCTRVVQDAEQRGILTSAPRGATWPTAIVLKTQQAFDAGFERRYDAILIDEGQDFTLGWWNLLREHALEPDGEMLLVTDPTQDIYDKRTLANEERMVGAGFTGPWTELKGSYRMPTDMVQLANTFAEEHIEGERLSATVTKDRADIVGTGSPSVRRWINLENVPDMGVEIGREVVRLLHEHPELSPRDITFICEYHHDGVAAVAVIEAAGHPVHHLFSRDPDDARRRRRYRFWPDAEAVKGCTVHSFKGWETPALVMGIGVERRSRRLAYVAMTRLQARHDQRPSIISVVNADKRLGDFKSRFESWAAPPAALRIG